MDREPQKPTIDPEKVIPRKNGYNFWTILENSWVPNSSKSDNFSFSVTFWGLRPQKTYFFG